MKTLDLEACPGCHAVAASTFAVGSTDLRRCEECELVYSPAYADPTMVYDDGYFTGDKGDFGLDTRHPEFQAFLNFVANRRLDMIQTVTRPPGSLLDVGCGNGEMLVVARERGWDVAGVDLVPEAVRYVSEQLGIEARNALLEDSGFPPRSFEVVCATHVLEHQTDGLGFLRSLARWCRPGGHLFIEVPNWHSLDRRNNGANWLGLRPLEHLAHYTPRTLAATMRRAGLRPVKTRTPSYQYVSQSLGQALHDLGLSRLGGPLSRLAKPGEQHGATQAMPRPPLRFALRGMEAAYDRAHVGVALVGIAQVP